MGNRKFWQGADFAPPLDHVRDYHRVMRDIFGGGGSQPAAPDYTPLSQASEKAAVLGKELGDAQLAEGKRQYDSTMKVAAPIVAAQADSMRRSNEQSGDYYSYGKSFRPGEQAMFASAFGLSPEIMTRAADARSGAQRTARTTFDADVAARRTDLQRRLNDSRTADQAAARLAAQNAATANATNNATGGLINYGGQAYSPQEFRRFLAENNDGNYGIGSESALEAARAAGYEFDRNGNYIRTTGPSSSATTSSTSTAGSTENSNTGRLQDQLAELDGRRFDPLSVDTGEADSIIGNAALAAQADKDARYWANSDPAQIDAYMRSQMPENEASARGIQDAYGVVQNAYGALQGAQTANNQSIYDQNKGDIEYGVGNALSDARAGYSSAINQALRQGMRYGYSPARLAAMAGTTAAVSASQQAAAANAARTQGIEGARGRMIAGAGTGVNAAGQRVAAAGAARDTQLQNSAYGLQRITNNRNFAIQDRGLDDARQLNVTGMARGMPGAATSAASVANAAGDSAVRNQMAPGNSYLANINAANGTTMQGQGMQIQGLGSALSGQAGIYNTQAQQNASNQSGFMGLLGAGLGAASKLPWATMLA
jgi:hypothetical protein